MLLQIRDGQLRIKGDTRTAGMARLKLDDGYHVIVHVIEIPGGHGLAPIEQTLPLQLLEKVEERRQAQRIVQASLFDKIDSSRLRDRERALSLISLMERRLREPLICTPVRRGNPLMVWAPEVPEWRSAGLEAGIIVGIELLP